MPSTYIGSHSLEEQKAWNDLYLRTRARKSKDYTDADIKVPDFYSAERDADQFRLHEVTVSDIFGLTWTGRKGSEENVGAPDYEGHLYYHDEDSDYCDEDGICISDDYSSENEPPADIYQKFDKSHRSEWINIADIKNVRYVYHLCNHWNKYSRIEYTYNDEWEEYPSCFYEGDSYREFIQTLVKFGKTDMADKLIKEINVHIEQLKNSEDEEIRHFYPGKTAEELYLTCDESL